MPRERRIQTNGRPMYGRPVTPRPKVKRSMSFRLSLVQRRGIILVVVVLVGWFLLSRIFSVTVVQVTPSNLTSVKDEAMKAIASNRWLSNTLTFSGGSLQTALLAADPSLKTVSAQRVFPGTIRVTVTMKAPSLGWVTGDQSYLLDGDGTAIGSLPAGATVPVVYDDSNLPVHAGAVVTSTRFVDFVRSSSVQIPNTGLAITHYEVKDTTLDLYLTTNRGYQLILDTSRAVGDEVGDLKAVLANLKQTGKTPTQYIDLRIAGRAYYK